LLDHNQLTTVADSLGQLTQLGQLIAWVLKDCGCKETSLAQFQILPRDARSLRVWDKDEYWRATAEGIEATLKGMGRQSRPVAAHRPA
jgi:hypothetical protein